MYNNVQLLTSFGARLVSPHFRQRLKKKQAYLSEVAYFHPRSSWHLNFVTAQKKVNDQMATQALLLTPTGRPFSACLVRILGLSKQINFVIELARIGRGKKNILSKLLSLPFTGGCLSQQ